MTAPSAVSDVIPFERYPALPSLFYDFLRGLPEFYPDPPTLKAAVGRGRQMLGRPARLSVSAFRYRRPAAARMAQLLAQGEAVAVVAGHQVGLFTGPLFTLIKALDAVRVARVLEKEGVAAAPVFWALTDDHDLEEVARTARPGPDGPEVLVLEGADRSNRRPVGTVPIPATVTQVLESFRADARHPEAEEILSAFARRSTPGATYGEAFIETLFDLFDHYEEPLLVVDPRDEAAQSLTAQLFELAVESGPALIEMLAGSEQRLRVTGKPVPVPFRPEVFPFFTIEKGERRRVENVGGTLRKLSGGEIRLSADVLTRPLLKSFVLPVAASILGPAEIAYHAQAVSLFSLFELTPPVLLPRSHLVLLGPAERRAAEALGVSRQDLLASAPPEADDRRGLTEAETLGKIARETDHALAALGKGLDEIDPTLGGALETTRRKVSYQVSQLNERMKKAVERKDGVASKRRKRLETYVRPRGTAAERLYPPLVPMLAHGREVLDAIRQGARGETRGGVIVDLAGGETE